MLFALGNANNKFEMLRNSIYRGKTYIYLAKLFARIRSTEKV